jgi:hypothetical protein
MANLSNRILVYALFAIICALPFSLLFLLA